jgi:hypothetical protein
MLVKFVEGVGSDTIVGAVTTMAGVESCDRENGLLGEFDDGGNEGVSNCNSCISSAKSNTSDSFRFPEDEVDEDVCGADDWGREEDFVGV